ATNFGAGTIGLAPHEDGIYQVGPLDNGETGNAFLYFSASGPQAVPQSFDFEVWDGNPLMGGTQLFTETYTYVSVQETLEAEPNKIESVTISPASPAVGDILTMTVVGRLGNGADRVLFAPATTSDWLADTFELRSTDIEISGVPVAENRLFYGTLPSPSVNQQPFTAVYSFLVTGPAATATQTSPSQYTQQDAQNWKHHRPSSTPFPVIPPLVYELSLRKYDGQTTYAPGTSTTYTIELTNTGNASVSDVAVADLLPPQLAATTTWSASYIDATGTLPTTPTMGDIAGVVSLDAFTGSVTITILADILSSATGDLINTVTATAPGDDPLSATDTNSYAPIVDLTLDKTTVGAVVAGQTVTYQVAIGNLGPSDVFAAAVTDPFAGVLSGVSWTAVFTDGSGAASGSGDIDELIDLASGGSAVYTVTGLLASSATGSLVNTATVTSPEDTATDTVTDQIVGE
ncbi:MAG: DUF11 domain-containing protein, partial [Actinobacteria bacterium]|nr:DUF11 domain-containing protein [Actinomycetota bacterium]